MCKKLLINLVLNNAVLLIALLYATAGCERHPNKAAQLDPPAKKAVDLGPILSDSSHGSGVALSPNEKDLVVCNRDSGSVTVFGVSYPPGQSPILSKRAVIELGEGSEPWQVVIHPDGGSAYVVLRRAQKLVKIDQIATAPVKSFFEAKVGSEPTGVALTPRGTLAVVPNWVNGTLSVISTSTMTEAMPPIDLNSALSAKLGYKFSRPAIAHPRAVAVTNHNGRFEEKEESVFVTDDFAQRTAPISATGGNADTSQKGMVYKVDLSTRSVKVVELGPLADMGFRVKEGSSIVTASCYPNQLQSINIHGDFAYVLSICASPKGPIGPVFPQVNNANVPCTTVAECSSLNLAEAACVVPQAGSPAACVDLGAVKTATAPLLSMININSGEEVAEGRVSLNAKFRDLFDSRGVADDNSRRYPLIANDLNFIPASNVGYISANGADAVFQIKVDVHSGLVTEVGTPQSQPFINLIPSGIATSKEGRGPIGVVTSSQQFAFAANDITRNISVLDLNSQTVAGGAANAQVVSAADLPVPGSPQDRVHNGKKFFNTGGGRWSLRGQGWNSCQSCHIDGLTDNVSWFFARGPRQTTSLDGTFSKKNPDTDQRVLNWTAIFDEIADFELNTRGVSGGVGAIVSSTTAPIGTGQRINLAAVPLSAGGTINHQGLSGSALAASDRTTPGIQGGVLADWGNITDYVKTIRAPRAPNNLSPSQVASGRTVFLTANCQGCHSGDKWTISKLFYDPKAFVSGGSQITTALKTTDWGTAAISAGFPLSLFPATDGNRTMRYNGSNAAKFDQLVCMLRPVGTFGIAESTVVAEGGLYPERRADMSTVAQGDEAEGKGFNPPSLLGMMTGAPYLHHGGARTLEALFSPTFAGHHQALSASFQPADQTLSDLVQFLLSIDGETPTVSAPPLGPLGGNFCAVP